MILRILSCSILISTGFQRFVVVKILKSFYENNMYCLFTPCSLFSFLEWKKFQSCSLQVLLNLSFNLFIVTEHLRCLTSDRLEMVVFFRGLPMLILFSSLFQKIRNGSVQADIFIQLSDVFFRLFLSYRKKLSCGCFFRHPLRNVANTPGSIEHLLKILTMHITF